MKYDELTKAEKAKYSQEIENRLSNLIESLEGIITDTTIQEAKHFLEHREWSICLQNIGYDYIELKTPINETAYNELVSLCHLMEIPKDDGDCWFYEKLIKRHSQ